MSVLKNHPVISGVFFFVFALSLVSAQADLQLEDDLQSMEEIQELLRNVQLILKAKISSTVREGNVLENVEMDDWNVVDKFNCGVSGLTGSCCRQIDILTFHEKCCLSLKYIPENFRIQVNLTCGSRTVMGGGISARNPPKFCGRVPYINIRVCLQFYNLNANSKSFSGCAKLMIDFILYKPAFKLGCFDISVNRQINEMDLPYLDGPQAPAEDPESVYIGEEKRAKMMAGFYKRNE